jgi:hypothetical protein
MKTKILVGAVAALLYGGVALAGDNKDCPPGYDKKDTSASMDSQSLQDESLSIVEMEPVDPAIGGSGQVGIDQQGLDASGQADVTADKSFGGSGQAGMSHQEGEVLLRCHPEKSGAATGGSGFDSSNLGSQEISEPIGGSGFQEEPLRDPQVSPPVTPAPTSDAFTPISDRDEDVKKESEADMRGLTLMVGGGIEGYSGALAPEINPGPAYGVTASIKPSKVLGIELGYSGAVNEIDAPFNLGGADGPDLVRNGGQAAVTFGLGAAPVQPYVLGGIGISDYNFRGSEALSGFSDDTVGNVPVGLGLRTHIGNFTADLRANYNFLFDQDFAGVDDGLNENGRYSGTLNIGGTF